MIEFLFAQVVSQTTYTCVNSSGKVLILAQLDLSIPFSAVPSRPCVQAHMWSEHRNTGRWLLTFRA